ncbi:MAG: hypothetical protein V2A74_06130, partial [bacterium]
PTDVDRNASSVELYGWAQRTLEVTGQGAPPPAASSPVQRRLYTERAAYSDALRAMTREIGKINLKEGETIAQLLERKPELKPAFENFIRKGAKQEGVTLGANDYVDVRLQLDLRNLPAVLFPEGSSQAEWLNSNLLPDQFERFVEARDRAKKAAILDAQRRAFATIKGMPMDSTSTIGDYLFAHPDRQSILAHYLLNLPVIEEAYDEKQGSALAIVQLDLVRVRRLLEKGSL